MPTRIYFPLEFQSRRLLTFTERRALHGSRQICRWDNIPLPLIRGVDSAAEASNGSVMGTSSCDRGFAGASADYWPHIALLEGIASEVIDNS
jgi:hypothetical protein